MVSRTLVAVVDDDESVRESLPDLLREFGCAARSPSTPIVRLSEVRSDSRVCESVDSDGSHRLLR